MLTALKIGNFKAYAETQHIPIRPLTLIYGANSAGKSSIIQSLLLANHALENGNVDVHQTKTGGEALDLGGFSQYIHKHDSGRLFEWGMEVEHKPIKSIVEYLGGFSRTGVRFQIGIATPDSGNAAFAPVPGVSGFGLDLDGCWLIRLLRKPDNRLYADKVNFDHPVLKAAIDKLILSAANKNQYLGSFRFLGSDESLTDEERQRERELQEETDRQRAEEAKRLLDNLEELKGFVSADIAKVPFSTDRFFPVGQVPEGEEDEYAYAMPDEQPDAIMSSFEERGGHWIARVLRFEIEKLFEAVGEGFSKRLRGVSYLGPLRCYPPRHLTGMHDQDPNWFSGGGQAWEILRRNPEVLKAVNQWLTAPDRLAKGYELLVRDLADIQKIAPELQAGLEDALGKLRADPNASITGQVESVLKKLTASKSAGVLSEIILQDIRSKTEVSHRDIGQGISQVLPVLVSAYALENQIIAIEQPEIHLHPALHAELGDVFIESALGEKKNTFILESHSEHLLLRIMRRIKETSAGILPPGMPSISPKDVAVLYVEPNGSRSIVREMPLNERGELIRDWPGGFFEEGLRELLT